MLFRLAAIAVALLLAAVDLRAHPAPFSYLDVHVAGSALSGRLIVHVLDVVHDLQLPSAEALTTEHGIRQFRPSLTALLSARLRFRVDGREVPWTVHDVRTRVEQDALELVWRADSRGMPGAITVEALLFPYDPNHQTFVNVFENGAPAWQGTLNRGRTRAEFFTGSRQGKTAIVRSFTASGIHHIAIGPDHILFIVGLLLLGGSLGRLLAIVTAFTVGHSVTLALATLDIFDPPARIVEPAIALSIVYVGADNLLAGERGRDVRAWIALAFGLVHGFGFAGVLRDSGLPPHSLGLTLFAFNVGVEIGQAAIVVVVASALALVRRQDAVLARRIAVAGSIAVVAAGAWWFVDRVF